MFETVEKLPRIVLTVEKSRMIHFLFIILLLPNCVHNTNFGYRAEPDDYNYVVSIQVSNVHLCVGTIIRENYVLTIAHVLIHRHRNELSVVPGASGNIHPADRRFRVEAVYMHPYFEKYDHPTRPDLWHHDVAMIKLAEDLTIRESVPVSRTELTWLPCMGCMVISWISSQTENGELLTKMWDFVYDRPYDDCLMHVAGVDDSRTCFSNIVRSTPLTSNDLGSPIICSEFMIGFVVQETENQTQETPSTFLETHGYAEFIAETTHEGIVDAVSPEEVSCIVSIWYNGSPACSGSILSSSHILTTANCVADLERTYVLVVAGYSRVPVNQVARLGISVKNITLHENYTGTREHDIAVLELEEPVPFRLTWHTFDLEDIREYWSGEVSTSYHWKPRWYVTLRQQVMELRQSSMKILTEEYCKSILESRGINLLPNHFCARNPYNFEIADNRDRGNPMFTDGETGLILVEVVPLAHPSAEISIFLWLGPYIDFIRSASG